MCGAGSLKRLFVFATIVASASYYFVEYGPDDLAALASVIFLGLITSATLAKLIRVKADLVRRRRLKKKFFKIKKLEPVNDIQ